MLKIYRLVLSRYHKYWSEKHRVNGSYQSHKFIRHRNLYKFYQNGK